MDRLEYVRLSISEPQSTPDLRVSASRARHVLRLHCDASAGPDSYSRAAFCGYNILLLLAAPDRALCEERKEQWFEERLRDWCDSRSAFDILVFVPSLFGFLWIQSSLTRVALTLQISSLARRMSLTLLQDVCFSRHLLLVCALSMTLLHRMGMVPSWLCSVGSVSRHPSRIFRAKILHA